MATLETQTYLRNKGLLTLEAEHHILVKRHQTYPNLVLLKYSQLETMMTPMTRECRGLILDESNNWQVVCYTYKRFPNLNGEGWGDTIDWNNTKILSKEDGSLIQLYHYDGNWNCATSGTPDASGNVGDFNLTFKQLFWDTWKLVDYKIPDNTNLSLAFELCTPFNQLVVRQSKSRLVLHGVRDLTTLQEIDPEPIATKYGWECVKSWPLITIENVMKATEALDPLCAEGFVVRDKDFHRIKVKSAQHVMLSHIRDNLTSSKRNIIEVIRKNEGAEYLSSFPEIKVVYDELKAKYEDLIDNIEATYATIKDQATQKDFAALAIKYKYSGALFAMRKVTSIRQFLADMTIKNLESWIE